MFVRWLTLAWVVVGLAMSWSDHLSDPRTTTGTVAVFLMMLALGFTALTTIYWRTDPVKLTTKRIVIIELCIGVLLLLGDGYIYADGRPQSLPWAWPSAGLIAAGIVFGRRWAVFAAAVLSLASFVGEGLNDEGFTQWGVTASSKAGLYVLTALMAGYVARRLRSAEAEISAARAREEIAVRLHDGVLQTLAVIHATCATSWRAPLPRPPASPHLCVRRRRCSSDATAPEQRS